MKEQSARLLVVDDDRAVRTALRVNLGRAGFEVMLAENAEDALVKLHEGGVDLVISDVRMPGMSGLELLAACRQRWPELPVLMMTGFGRVEDAVNAMKAGAAEYIAKPVSKNELVELVRKALRARAMEHEIANLRAAVDERYGFENLIGSTPAIREAFTLAATVAESDALVLLTGETGTGKELFARAVHVRSPRRSAPFVGMNCAAIPEGLLESELFGHERGSFTGAVRQHRGKFEQADGGTLLLDEIGDLPLAAQTRLLRVLETGEVQRVGGAQAVKVDVRVIAATHQALRQAVQEGKFREDLYYRLNVFHIEIPALRERRDDIPLLVDHFISKFARQYGKPARRCSPEVQQQLLAYHWPGNVRELEHTVERAVLLCPGEVIEAVKLPEPLPATPGAPEPRQGSLTDAMRALERRMIIDALRASQGVQARAARQLGISRSNLNYRIRRLGIQVKDIQYT